MKIQWQPYFDKADILGAFGNGGKQTEDEVEKDDLRLMEGKEEKKEEKKDSKEEDIDPDNLIEEDDLLEENEEDKEDDKEDEEEKKDDEDLVDEEEDTNARAVDFKKLKEKFPELSKTPEFKQLRDAYFREGKLTEIFPTVEEAQEASENNASFIKLNDEILNKGSVGGLFNAIKEVKPELLNTLAENILDQLSSIDKDSQGNSALYAKAITPVVRKLAHNIWLDGKKQLKRDPEDANGKILVAVARNITQWAFDDGDMAEKEIEVKKEETKEDDSKLKEVEKREQAIATKAYTSALNTAKSSLDKHLDKLISDGLDPNDQLSDFVKDSITEKIRSEVEKQISADSSHIKKMQGLWKRAKEADYDRTSLSRIVAAYLERAKPIIPKLRNTYKNRALGKRVTEEREETVRKIKTRTGRAPERDGKVNMRAVDTKKIDYSQTSDEDLMSGKVKLRG